MPDIFLSEDAREKSKTNLKYLLIEYYKIKINPDLSIEGKILDNFGFKPCSNCHN